ncbi:MAG TPA: enoyl-CoA hydratase-related protein [Acidimicrobiales bacterium]|nr:enoyl-CoA hydratase-related protein [Acidimicrobiales bacterium]
MGDELVHMSAMGGIAKITLDSPANRNALSDRLVEELETRLGTALADGAVRAVHLTATGTVFCAGADLKGGGSAVTSGFPRILAAVLGSAKPVVAEVNGHVRAGGVGLVAACDIVVAPAGATFALNEVRLGLLPAIVAVPLLRRVSARALTRWLMTGEAFGAEEAAAAGLVSMAVPDDRVAEVTAAVLDALRLGAPGALAGIKPLLASVACRGVDDGLVWAAAESAGRFASEEAAEGLAAFRGHRPPRWAPADG